MDGYRRPASLRPWLRLNCGTPHLTPPRTSPRTIRLVAPRPRSFERSNALYERAAAVIPTASQTFSKASTQLVRGASPLFLDRGDGAFVWDVDDNRYLDHVLALLPVVLGYCDPHVDQAITRQLERGISFSLATELEVELAERLVRIMPCAEMVRFGKNGSDVTSAAIRLARASTGRERVLACGYHGWHDWYIGNTTRDLGVPRAVAALTHSFPFNDADALEALLVADPDGYAAVILEPAGLADPEPGFLEQVRALCDRYGVVLVFDEIVTGFRLAMGGAQEAYGVVPDLATVGKAMGNGMPIAALVGRREIMSLMEKIFFSGTFGGEALSLAAAIATIDKLDELDAPTVIARAGSRLAGIANDALEAEKVAERVAVGGAAWLPRFQLEAGDLPRETFVSLVRQELVAAGLLATGGLNICVAHDSDVGSDEAVSAWQAAASAIRDVLHAPDPARLLRGEPVEMVFQPRG